MIDLWLTRERASVLLGFEQEHRDAKMHLSVPEAPHDTNLTTGLNSYFVRWCHRETRVSQASIGRLDVIKTVHVFWQAK